MTEFKTILATKDVVEFEISEMQNPLPEDIKLYIKNNEDDMDSEFMWIIQEAMINLNEVEMAYQYCGGVTQIDFRSGNGIKLLVSYDEFKQSFASA